MTKDKVTELFNHVFQDEIMALREAGQREYAHDSGNAFANFERVADDLGLDRKLVLWTYARKHFDGIAAYLKGHKSQREDVRGRINDGMVYLLLLRAMIDEDEGGEKNGKAQLNLPV